MQIHDALPELAGEWTYQLTHRLLPGEVIGGSTRFEILEGGKFLLQRARVEHPRFPDSSLAVIGGQDELRMHYFDSRGVVRIFELTVAGRVWTFTRDKPDFSPLDFHQRMTWTLGDGQTFHALGEISDDGVTWQDDVHVDYRRA